MYRWKQELPVGLRVLLIVDLFTEAGRLTPLFLFGFYESVGRK
jgi:hypothetical protein